MELFGRSFSLKFYNKYNNLLEDITEIFQQTDPKFKVTFHVNQKIGLINEIAEFHIYNLSQSTRQKLLDAVFVTFSCGYKNNLKFCYQGNIMNMFDNRQQPDFLLSIFCLDFTDHILPLNLVINSTLTDRQAIKIIANTVPTLIAQDNNLQGLTDRPLQKSISLVNTTYTQAYQKLALLLNINIWITNGMVYSSSKTYKPQSTSEEIVINYLNGMVGSPVFDIANAGVNVQSLLNCSLIPGNSVRIQTLSPTVQLGEVNYARFNQNDLTNGSWEIMEVDHIGDSRGQEWYTFVQGYSYATDLRGLISEQQ